MTTTSDFRIHWIQASAFSYDGDSLRPPYLLRYVLNSWADIYTADPVSIPLPADASEDFPNLILSSEDGVSRIEASRGRINVVWSRQEDSSSINLSDVLGDFEQRLVQLFDDQGSRIGRLATAIIREAEAENAGQQLAQQYCSDRWLNGPLNRPDGFELHAHKVFDLSPDLTVNSWMRIKAAPSISGQERSIRVEQDLNTLAQRRDTLVFSDEKVHQFFERAGVELDNIMSLYFPAPSNS